tara:strand:+ start:176 stop:406 length:231 start_codon:yes stop_codon:yes gene_type:complete
MVKSTQTFITERYELQHRREKNALGIETDFWFIYDMTKKRYGKIVAKFWVETPAIMSLEYLNHKKKLRKRKVRNGM